MLKKIYKMTTPLFVAAGFFSTINSSFAIHSTLQDAEELRNKITQKGNLSHYSKKPLTKSIVLPVSRGFDQAETCLCWSYAFFNALETLYLVKHPEAQLELSRGAMQYINLQDRIDLKIVGIEDHLDPEVYKTCWAEGGTPLSADYILKNYGAVPFSEYHDIISPPTYTNLYYTIFIDHTTPKQKRALADSLLLEYFGDAIPEYIHFNGRPLNKLDFSKEILPEGKWNTYAISQDGSDYIAQGSDPDARRGEQTHFVPKDTFVQKINQSLAEGRPIIYASKIHATLIYGADYNENGEPVSFYIKDSFERLGYYYKADFKKAMDEVSEITILENESA